MATAPSNYWTDTHTPLYSFIFSLPLFLMYEIGMFTISTNDLPMLRNGADVLMRQILGIFGVYGMYGFSGSFLVGFIVAFLRQKNRLKSTAVKGEYLLLMLLESLVLAILLTVLLTWVPTLLMNGRDGRLVQQIVLSIGAGIYEEFVFRVVLIAGLTALLGFLFQWGRVGQKTGAVFLAAVLFSLFHFVGEFGDTPGFGLFIIRLAAGLFLGIVYVLRGFGVAAYTHAIYNLFVLVQITTFPSRGF